MIRLFAFLTLSLAAAPIAGAKPSAVSLDYCADQYLLALADEDQIIAVSRGADERDSYLRAVAVKHPMIRPEAEEVLALEPDIVLRQWGGGVNAEAVFSKFGAQVVSIGFPADFDGVRHSVRIAAASLEQEARGEELITQMDARLDALKKTAPPHRRALYITPGGVTAGGDTMVNAMIEAAGLINIPAELGQSWWPSLPLETLLLDPPEFIIAGFFNAGAEASDHWSAGRHPLFQKLFQTTPTIHISPDIISCAGWFAVDGAETIAAAAKAPR